MRRRAIDEVRTAERAAGRGAASAASARDRVRFVACVPVDVRFIVRVRAYSSCACVRALLCVCVFVCVNVCWGEGLVYGH